MSRPFRLGCHYRNTQAGEDVSVLRKFERIRESGVFDYIDWLPRPEMLDECIAASRQTGVPMLTGTWYYALGRDEPMLERDLRNAARAGLEMVNLMIFATAGDGHAVSDEEVVDRYLRTWELGEKLGVTPSFEVHVDCWSEQFARVRRVVDAVRRRGTPFYLTVDYSHAIFKIEQPHELEISGIREDVEAGRVALDPFEPRTFLDEWLETNAVAFAQFRPVVPNNPKNVGATRKDGLVGRGIQYPFVKPAPGEWHAPWYAYKLEACKEAIRKIFRYHLSHEASPLRYVTTEMITSEDYGMNVGYSVWEHNVHAARWVAQTWDRLSAMHTAGIPLAV